MENWDLTKLYPSYESDEFQNDLKKFDQAVDKTNAFKERFKSDDYQLVITNFLLNQVELSMLVRRLASFISLSQATNTTDPVSSKYMMGLMRKQTELTEVYTMWSDYISSVPELDNVLDSSDFLKEHAYNLKNTVKSNKFNLDKEMETLLSKLGQSSGSLWSKMQGVLTSTLEVEFNGEILTLPEIINKQETSDPKVRKAAYEAELAAYKKIDKAVAFAMNGIKGQVNTLSEKRGYSGALERTLINSRMKEETLNAMISAMKDYLPEFRKYLKRKGEYLGHKNGLPWYDLYAPIGESSKEFTIPEAQDYILKNFSTFSEHLRSVAERAFTGNWIDYKPYKGKRGGAFCANLRPINESRILSNFTGGFGDVITLAHELGHAYHGDNIFTENPLGSYTMPLAETASTFCETIVKKAALKDAKGDEKLSILESDLQGTTAVIVDIMSRYIFESNVFDEQKTNFLDENKLKELMLDAQKQTYGDGLDPDYLHPYMWLWKPHYYSTGLSFYNFPYAFGLLFAKGLYGVYQQEGPEFTEKYDELLKATVNMDVEDVALMAGIDVTKKEFWKTSLEVIKEDIDLFLKLTK
ncbi:Oligoendopeptidase F, plasmid [Candidatus Izimaplasma bacterium HR1]|jgi:pepF/M3 family oligoendopeptidase|uniref:M3 family oligoendopeptidase n=1 Tax=Candidatus Izimoplasma sp. HR1 TaxID=1541959 RepID=UPI0004F5F6E9|nr:Oligoendopeptidase F, plasmid [Candidatus Izimaplasma bacterium HR1]